VSTEHFEHRRFALSFHIARSSATSATSHTLTIPAVMSDEADERPTKAEEAERYHETLHHRIQEERLRAQLRARHAAEDAAMAAAIGAGNSTTTTTAKSAPSATAPETPEAGAVANRAPTSAAVAPTFTSASASEMRELEFASREK
jgi:hypothetical protein